MILAPKEGANNMLCRLSDSTVKRLHLDFAMNNLTEVTNWKRERKIDRH